MEIVHTNPEMIILAAKNLIEITQTKVLTEPHIVALGNLVRDQEAEAVTINLIETEATRDTDDPREEIPGHPTVAQVGDMTTLKTEVQILTKVLPAQPTQETVILRMTVEIVDPMSAETISKKTQATDLHLPEGIILPQTLAATLDLI
jgi:hypothetical protein